MKYEKIINHPHYEPKNHPRMSREMRAGQFAPYAALVGYADAIQKTARLSDLRSHRKIDFGAYSDLDTSHFEDMALEVD